MSDQSDTAKLADELRKEVAAMGHAANCTWTASMFAGEGSTVCDCRADRLRALADKVEALGSFAERREAALPHAGVASDGDVAWAKENAERGGGCPPRTTRALIARIAKLEAVLREAQSLTHPPPSSANITPRHQLAEIAVVCSAALSFTEARAEG